MHTRARKFLWTYKLSYHTYISGKALLVTNTCTFLYISKAYFRKQPHNNRNKQYSILKSQMCSDTWQCDTQVWSLISHDKWMGYHGCYQHKVITLMLQCIYYYIATGDCWPGFVYLVLHYSFHGWAPGKRGVKFQVRIVINIQQLYIKEYMC